jgi:phage shock protein B
MNWDLVVIFAGIVALAVVRGHYRVQKNSGGAGLASADQAALRAATDLARRLEGRIETLENVLDEDVPGWRARIRS